MMRNEQPFASDIAPHKPRENSSNARAKGAYMIVFYQLTTRKWALFWGVLLMDLQHQLRMLTELLTWRSFQLLHVIFALTNTSSRNKTFSYAPYRLANEADA